MEWRTLRFDRKLGIAGVSPYETVVAKQMGRWFEWPMLLLALLIPIRWYFEYKGGLAPEWIPLLNRGIWGLFMLETLIVTFCVRDKSRYLRSNWLNLLIIVTIFPPLWQYAPLPASLRLIRLLVLVDVYIRMIKAIYEILRRNSLGTTLLASAIIIMISGVMIFIMDPAFSSPFEGVWWAWVTVSTVGYGDYVPVSTVGRIFAVFLILLGMGLFALLTAHISAVLIGRVDHNLDNVGREVEQLEEDEAGVQLRLERIEQRLKRIEALMQKKLDG